MEKITEKQFIKAHEAVEKAREDDTPFLARTVNDELLVVGDPNKTGVVKTSHIITYRFLKDELAEIPEGAKIVGNYVIVKVEYKDVMLNGHNDLLLIRSLQKMVSIFDGLDTLKETVDKKTEELNKMGYSTEKYKEELKKINDEFANGFVDLYAYADKESQESLYDFVAALLEMDEFEKEHALATSVVATFCEFIVNNSNLWNEAETLFGF